MTTASAAPQPQPGAGMGAAALIKLDGVKKVFFTDEMETHALAEIHLEIREGEYVAIGGPSGCGKSTCLRIVAGLETASDGRVEISGRDVTNLPPAARASAIARSGSSFRPST